MLQKRYKINFGADGGSMQISEFNGIVKYHDGGAVSDYCNMIPLGDSVIDRQGELYADNSNRELRPGVHVLETFVDSKMNIYIACSDGILHRYGIDNGRVLYYGGMDGMEITEDISFCESSTKPSQVYCATAGNVYYWNTEAIKFDKKDVPEEYQDRYKAFKPIRLPVIVNASALKNPADASSGYFPVVNNDNYNLDDTSACPKISNVTWFDNRLVMVSSENNTVFLSDVDPSRYLFGNPPKPILSPIEATTETNDYTVSFIPAYYSSTASSARLHSAIAFAGSLYFLNDTSIEIWSATGNYDNPIQHNMQNTLFYGGRSPVIIADILYLICRDSIHNDFVVSINSAGAIKRVSNGEIERQLQPKAFRLRPLSVRDESMVVCYNDKNYKNGYSITKSEHWWRYVNQDWHEDFIVWSLLNVDGTIYSVTYHGFIAKTTDDNRCYVGGKRRIPRHIRGAFTQFTQRKILRNVEIICDTGVYFDLNTERPKFYLRVSFDRGLHFGPFFYRVAGAPGVNDRRMIWRNCGSGNSLMIEFGTSDDIRFQIYGLDLNIQ